VTSLSRLLGHRVEVEHLRPIVERHLARCLELAFEPAPAAVAAAFGPAADVA
jgi:hypothetical protein